MRLFTRLGLRTRLALALVGVALFTVGVATLLANRGLHSRVSQSAESRLERSARHFAEVAGAVYREEGAWTPQARQTLVHLALVDELRFAIDTELPEPTAVAPVVVAGAAVGTISVAPLDGELLSPEEAHLQSSLDRLHLAAAVTSGLAALLIALLLAETMSRPLRKIRDAALQVEAGKLETRVDVGGAPEVQAVGHAFNRLVESLEEEEAIRKASVADLAHELRTPVSALLSRIEAAQDGVLPNRAANLHAMHAEALRLARLLDDLGRLADAERPGLLLEKRVVDLAEIAGREGETYAPLFATKGVTLHLHLDGVLVRADQDRLGQIVGNLLSNALRYTDPGGSVDVTTGRWRSGAVLEVSDTGAGIPEADLQHVFTRFWRGEKSRSRVTGGAGIGLAIVYELAHAHDGVVEVESTLGAGSTFRVVLPAAAGGRSAAPSAEPAHDAQVSRT